MHVITKKHLDKVAKVHPELAGPLDVWYRIAKKAKWKTFVELKMVFPKADLVNPYVVFDIKGNSFRMICEVYFNDQTILVRHILTHAEYDKKRW